MISFRIDWFDLLAVQRTLKSLPQHHSPKASISLVLSFLYNPTLTPYMTTGKTIALVMPSNHLILCCPLLLLPSVFSSIRVFSNELALCIRWPKHWSFSFSISPSGEYSVLISFRIDWFDLLAVQGTLKNIFQHHCSKATILRCSYGPTLTSIHDYWKNLSVD